MSLSGYLRGTASEPLAAKASALFLLPLVLIGILAGLKPGPLPFAALGGLVFILAIIWKREVFPMLFLVYLSALPEAMQNSGPISYYPTLGSVALIATALIFFLHGTPNFNAPGSDSISLTTHPSDATGILIFLFFSWTVVETFLGLAAGYPTRNVLIDLNYVILILGYFIWRFMFRNHHTLEWWFRFFAIVGLLTAISYFVIVYINWTDIVSFVVYRVVTRQGHTLLVAIPFTVALLLIDRWHRRRWLWGALSLLLFVFLFFTQQRALWLAIAIELGLFFTLYAFRNGFSRKGFRFWFGGISVFVIIVAALLGTVLYIFQTDLDVLFKRWQDFGSLQDASTKLRYYDIRHTMNVIRLQPIIGYGIGKMVYTIPNARDYFYIDNTYLTVWLKGGMIMLILFIGIYFSALVRSWIAFRRHISENQRILAIGVLTALSGIVLVGTTNVSMLLYPHVFVWSFALAAGTILYESLSEAKLREGG